MKIEKTTTGDKDAVRGDGKMPLAEVVGRMLAERGMTIAVAESCTGGLIASMITDIPGASVYFEGGVVSYSNRAKQELLGVTEETLRAHGAVSPETAIAMAEGVRRLGGTSIGIGVTGIAGPGGATPEKPLGTVHIAIASESGTAAHSFCFSGDRLRFKQIAAATAIDLVRKYLLKAPI